MRIEINGETYTVPPDYVKKLSQDLGDLAINAYETKLGDTLQQSLMILTRGLLVAEEMRIRKAYGKEAARAMRPPPKSDPNLWLFRLLLPHLEGILNNATIICETESDTVTAFNVTVPNAFTNAVTSESVGGGLVGTHRDAGIGKNNGA